MKANTHPQFFEDAVVTCACGNKIITGSTVQSLHVELCSKCHPFYTGEQRFVDSASRIQKFQEKQVKASTIKYTPKRIKKLEDKKRASQAPQTLREMLAALK